MKKFLSILITLCLCVSVSFAEFDPYADEEPEGKPTKKLIYGIVFTLIGGVLTYDGFSQVEEDVSNPSVNYSTVLHSEYNQYVTTSTTDPFPEFEEKYFGKASNTYGIKSGISEWSYEIDGTNYNVEKNILYNNGNVDLYNITVEVRYKYPSSRNNDVIADDGHRPYANGTQTSDGYHVATVADVDGSNKTVYSNLTLKRGESLTWQDIWGYCSTSATAPNGNARKEDDPDDLTGLNLGTNALDLMDVRVILNKNAQYKPKIHKRNKSDIEGVAGILMCAAGIYFIIDYFVDMHKFNVYANKHQLNMKIAAAPNEYKLLLQKRI